MDEMHQHQKWAQQMIEKLYTHGWEMSQGEVEKVVALLDLYIGKCIDLSHRGAKGGE